MCQWLVWGERSLYGDFSFTTTSGVRQSDVMVKPCQWGAYIGIPYSPPHQVWYRLVWGWNLVWYTKDYIGGLLLLEKLSPGWSWMGEGSRTLVGPWQEMEKFTNVETIFVYNYSCLGKKKIAKFHSCFRHRFRNVFWAVPTCVLNYDSLYCFGCDIPQAQSLEVWETPSMGCYLSLCPLMPCPCEICLACKVTRYGVIEPDQDLSNLKLGSI